jgi:hypothetical protein
MLALALLAVAYTLKSVNEHEPLVRWFFWRYAAVYGLTLLFGLACFATGHTLLTWSCRKDPMAVAERVLFDVAAGVVGFGIATFLVGVLHGLGGVYFWALPATLIAIGAPMLVRDVRGMRDEWRRTRTRAPMSTITALAVGLGAIGLLFVYLPILSPENISFDSRWYHLAIAEHYVAAGRIGPFPEGWHLGTLPHLGSWIYTWAMACPVLDLHGRLALAAHMEFFLFLGTLAAVPLLVARLTCRHDVRGTWAVFFLFPGLFLYDSSLSTGADHILAFWAIPVALAAHRFVCAFTPGRAVVLAVAVAGAGLTKMQSMYLLVPAALYVVVHVGLALRARRERPRRMAFVLGVPFFGSLLLLTAAHWLANAIWYHNPVFPMLASVFPSKPWRTELVGSLFDGGWTPAGELSTRLLETLLSPIKFAFVAHDWAMFHRDVPVFGFLFTLSLPLLLLLRRSGKIWVLTAGVFVGVMVWFWTYHQDRYLQALLPWMVVVTACVFIGAWNTGRPARIGVVAMIAVQLIWGGDVPFISTRLGRDNAMMKAMHTLSSTFRGDETDRIDPRTGWEKVSAALPASSVALLHLTQLRLGLEHPVVTDNPRWNAALLPGQLEGPRAAWQQLRDWGVTHMILGGDRCEPDDLNLRSELATHDLALNSNAGTQWVDGKNIVTLSAQEPRRTSFGDVFFSGCTTRGRVPWSEIDHTVAIDGTYPGWTNPNLPTVTDQMFDGLQYAVIDDRCSIAIPSSVSAQWQRVSRWKQVSLWVRKE